jgi:hypothetical protein
MEFARVAKRDITSRLRIANGRQIVGIHSATYSGLATTTSALLPLATSGAADPMAASNFLTNSACMHVGGARYKEAKEIAQLGVTYCTDLRLDFAIGFCLVQRAAAEIGLRDFGQLKPR